MCPLLSIRSAPLARAGIGVLVFIAVLSGLAGKGICNSKNTDLIGCWQNKSLNDNDISVTLKVTANVVELDFDELACEAECKLKSDANKSTCFIRAPRGGSLQGCEDFREAQMTLTLNSDGSLLMHIKPKKTTDKKATLTKKSCD